MYPDERFGSDSPVTGENDLRPTKTIGPEEVFGRDDLPVLLAGFPVPEPHAPEAGRIPPGVPEGVANATISPRITSKVP